MFVVVIIIVCRYLQVMLPRMRWYEHIMNVRVDISLYFLHFGTARECMRRRIAISIDALADTESSSSDSE